MSAIRLEELQPVAGPVPAVEREGRSAPDLELPAHVWSGTIPELLEILRSGEDLLQSRALRLLCPCRNRRYDREVWMAIFQLYETTANSRVRDDAEHAVNTLRERVKTDPRSQELVQDLAESSLTAAKLAEAVPKWEPRSSREALGPGLEVPRWERPHRSRANRRR